MSPWTCWHRDRSTRRCSCKAERPDALPIEGGTDVMVELNFDRRRPDALLNLNEVPELQGLEPRERRAAPRRRAHLHAGDGATRAALPALAEASRTVGSPQIRNRGTIGGNLGTASPAGDALPPLLVENAEVELASVARHAPDAARASSSSARSETRSPTTS